LAAIDYLPDDLEARLARRLASRGRFPVTVDWLITWKIAESSMEHAREALERGNSKHCVSSSCNAARFAVRALLAQQGHAVRGADDVETALRREFVLTHRVTAQLGEDYAVLRQLELRQSDIPNLPVDASLARSALGCASRILEELEKLRTTGTS
jgi:HEPN domain-containing protein